MFFDEQLAYPTQVSPHVYLGSVGTLDNKAFMATIHKVISVMENPPYMRCAQMIIPIADSKEVSIACHFETVIQQIRVCKDSGKNVLLHCEKGMSRSASFAVAWLLQERHDQGQVADYDDVLRALVCERSLVAPNAGFASQLRDFSNQLNRTRSEPSRYTQ